LLPWNAECRAGTFSLLFGPQIKPFLAIKPVDPLVIDLPALSAQEDTDSFISIAHSDCSDLADLHPKNGLLVSSALVSVGGTSEAKNNACTAFTHAVAFLEMIDQGSFSGRPYNYFDSTS
jgi:hypothetical protein